MAAKAKTTKTDVKQETAKAVSAEIEGKGERGRTSNRDLAARLEKRNVFFSVLAAEDCIDNVGREGGQYVSVFLKPHGSIVQKSRYLIAKNEHLFDPDSDYVYALDESQSRYYMGGFAMINLDLMNLEDVSAFAAEVASRIKSAPVTKSLREIIDESRNVKNKLGK